MAIADQLVSINTSKLEIKAAIETKGVTVGTVPLADYAEKILAITTGSTPPTPPVPEPWVRPADWLTMPTVTATQQVVYVLMAVNNAAYNLLALACAGAYTVDWGDGVVENFATGVQANHNFDWAAVSAGTLTSKGYRQALVTITPQAGQNLTSVDLSRKHTLRANYQTTNSLDVLISGPNLTSVQVSAGTAAATSQHTILERIQIPYCAVNCGPITISAFCCQALRVWSANNNFLISQGTAFNECYSIQELPALRVSGGGSSGIFSNCYNLLAVGTITVESNSNFPLSNIFIGCTELFQMPVITIVGTGKINSTSSMFSGCRSITSISNFSTLDTSAVTNMATMFFGCSLLTTVPELNTAVVSNMSGMFNGCSSLTTVPELNTAAVTNMSQMFQNCFSLESVPFFNTAAVTNMSSMFINCYSLESVPLFNTAAVNTMANMFQNCTSLMSVPAFTTNAVTSTLSMFDSCSTLSTISALNLPVCTTMASMFNNCYSLRVAPTITTSASLTNSSQMFQNCTSLAEVGLFTTSSVTTVNSMFQQCRSLTIIPAYNFAAVTTGNGQFISVQTFWAANNLNKSQVTGLRFTHSYVNANLSAAELDAIYTNLGTATAQTITVTGNPGAAGDTPSIATAKGWTVVG